jgi:hypothetical protein
MRFEGAVIEEQNTTFAVVVVKQHVVQDPLERNRTIATFQPVFPRLPIVLMAQDFSGTPTYYGRRDIADFMAKVPLSAIPWREYTIG